MTPDNPTPKMLFDEVMRRPRPGWFRDETLQEKVNRILTDVFGAPNQVDLKERLLRFFEEAVELVRAAGLSDEAIQNVVSYELGRAPGPDVLQEFGGAGVTLFAAAQAYGLDLLALVNIEIDRVALNKAKCQAKHAAKPDHVVSTRATQ